MRRAWVAVALAPWVLACGGPSSATVPSLDAAAESYVRLVLALGERDRDSLDAYHGPREWRADALYGARDAPGSAGVGGFARGKARVLRRGRRGPAPVSSICQLRAVVARVDVVRGRRSPFAEEARALFGLDVPPGEHGAAAASVREAIDRLLPGAGDLSARYAAFDRRFLIAPDRLPARDRWLPGGDPLAHIRLPPAERVEVEDPS